MVRAIGGRDFDLARRAFEEWPLLEALFAFREIARDRAAHKYEFECLGYWLTGKDAGGQSRTPRLPEVLKEMGRHGRS
jgi:hypothetical protein